MRALSFSVALMCAASTPALAATASKTCARAGDTRTIEVVTPGQVGKACDLNIIRDNGANRSTPYHANNGAEFCEARAKAIVSGLAGEGFSCVETPAAAPAKAVDAAPAAAEPVAAIDAPLTDQMETLIAKSTAPEQIAPETAAPAPLPALAPASGPALTEAAAPPASVAQSTPVQTVAAPPSATIAPNIAPGAAPKHVIEQPSVAAAAPQDAEQPVQQFASAGPVALSPTNASAALKGVRAPRSAAGRFVGAAADAKPLDAAPDQEIEERLGSATPTVQAGAQPAAARPAAATAVTPAAAPKARAAEDIIKSVLAAQTAAWNEGDLEGFMGVFWKDPDLKFVSGSTVAKGWKETMNRYRTLYGEGPAMGRMTVDGLDIDFVTDDVATVVGRYRVARTQATDVGVFTLVMKRFDGLWRIVHDHTTPETPNTN